MQQGEQWASGDVLCDDGELAGVVQTRPDKMDDAGMIETTEDGDFSAEHVHVRLGAVRVGPVAAELMRSHLNSMEKMLKFIYLFFPSVQDKRLPFYGHNFIPVFAFVDSAKGAWV